MKKANITSILLLSLLVLGLITNIYRAQAGNDDEVSENTLTTSVLETNGFNYSKIEDYIRKNYETTSGIEWLREKIELLIIARDEDHVVAMTPLAEWKTTKGVPAKIVNSSEYLQYEGFDVVEKIRNCIKDYYNKYGIKWVLLAGDANIIPMREVYNPDSAILDDFSEWSGSEYYKPTDFYYAELTGNWDSNGNGIFGESQRYSRIDEIDWNTEVYVGRFPGSTASELEVMVNKTINYEKNPLIGEWMNDILLSGAVQGRINSEDSDGEEESFLVEQIIAESIPSSMDITKLIETNHPIPGFRWTNFTRSLFNQYIDSGSSIVFYAGHGSPNSFDGLYAQPNFYTKYDALDSLNERKHTLFYADACSTSFIDGSSVCSSSSI